MQTYKKLCQRVRALRADIDSGEISREILMVKYVTAVDDFREYLKGSKYEYLLGKFNVH